LKYWHNVCQDCSHKNIVFFTKVHFFVFNQFIAIFLTKNVEYFSIRSKTLFLHSF